jgi:hypothetical protein
MWLNKISVVKTNYLNIYTNNNITGDGTLYAQNTTIDGPANFDIHAILNTRVLTITQNCTFTFTTIVIPANGQLEIPNGATVNFAPTVVPQLRQARLQVAGTILIDSNATLTTNQVDILGFGSLIAVDQDSNPTFGAGNVQLAKVVLGTKGNTGIATFGSVPTLQIKSVVCGQNNQISVCQTDQCSQCGTQTCGQIVMHNVTSVDLQC